ncbi:MAG: dihydropteroate synthase [Flaviaesturariibacter sp.]|nr:dihydropteroate synthase [Flaviaesturariibacter sp.]
MSSINCKSRLLSFDEPVVMGILNTTPDSFHAESRVQHVEHALRRAEEMLVEGAGIIDIGGQSTRPGSERVSEDEELARVMPAVENIARNFPLAVLSIDTFYSKVARYAVEAGASIVNDVSAGSIDPLLIPTVAELRVPYVLMHMQGDPQTMQAAPRYDDVLLDVFDALNRKRQEIEAAGIIDVIIDPGFGFGKTRAHNYRLLAGLSVFTKMERPLLIGLSRKGMVYKPLGITPEEAGNGTSVLNTLALQEGASILRVHDVREARQAVQLFGLYRQQKEQPGGRSF